MPENDDIKKVDDLEIESLSDEALESVAGGSSTDGPVCCSCDDCSDDDEVEAS